MHTPPILALTLPRVVFVHENQAVEVPRGTSVRKAALSIGIEPNRDFALGVHCPDIGLCGQCLVHVRAKPGATNERNLRERLLGAGRGWSRLACQAIVLDDIEVWTQRGGNLRAGLDRELLPAPRPSELLKKDEPAGDAGAAPAADEEAAADG
ncbi:MAG: 2Fe-2S iron-sulfur cluster binding domain-containing protein [Deltaproteobacteria bacterium]|nr:2Fe-2S iron-sulfur cluster binding domain-containing protein [Deltaproteobacteria bacterium]